MRYALPGARCRMQNGSIDCEGLVVDGQLLDGSSLQALFSEYEGWEFELNIPLELER